MKPPDSTSGLTQNLGLRCHVGETWLQCSCPASGRPLAWMLGDPLGLVLRLRVSPFCVAPHSWGGLEPPVSSASFLATKSAFTLYSLSVGSMRRKSTCERFYLMNPIRNCKVKPWSGFFCKCDALFFRFFFPKDKKIPLKLKIAERLTKWVGRIM